MNLVNKINSFIDNGLVSASTLATNITSLSEQNRQSFDDGHNDVVSLNAISSEQGAEISLFNSAKGGISVGIEESVTGNEILQFFLEKNTKKIDAELENLSLKYSFIITQVTLLATARKNILLQDRDFINQISERTHFTALFILQNLEAEGDEGNSFDGCRETSRSSIPPEKIHRILVSQNFEEALQSLQEKITFIPSIEEEISFTYKDERGNLQTFSIPGVFVPNYKNILEEYFRNRTHQDQPLFTHMTRLPLPENE